MTKFDTTHGPNDPLYGNMWYINPAYHPPNQPQRDKFLHGDALRHMNVTGAWSQLGVFRTKLNIRHIICTFLMSYKMTLND